MNNDQRIKTLTLLSPLSVSPTREGNIKLSLQNCSVHNIALCKEYADARQASPSALAPHPTLKKVWVHVKDDLDQRYAGRNVPCELEAKNFTTALRLLYNLAADPGNIVVRSHEEDAGWGNANYTAHVAYRFNGEKWENLPDKKLHEIRSLGI